MQKWKNKWKGKNLFLIVKCQLMNVERVINFEKLLFGKHHSSNWFSQQASTGAKTSGWKLSEKWNI